MLTPKFKEFAAEFQSGAVGMFVAYMRHGEKEAWERYCEDIGDLPNDKDFDVSEIVDEIEDYLLTKLPKDERENYLLGVIGVFDFYVEYRELLMDEIMEDRCVGGWEMSFGDFAKTLYLMLLSHGIDMMRLQEECGIYLMEEPDVETVGMWLGSMKLAKKYLEAIQKKREPQQEEKPVDEVKYQQEEKNATEPREINQERLREYFTLTFSGSNKSNTDYFKEYLLPKLMEKMNAKYYAKIFLLMYQSPNLKHSMKPRTFTKFYEDMCEITGVEFINGYKPNRLTMTDKEKKDYYYLTDKIK